MQVSTSPLQFLQLRPDERGAIIGQSGTGKTYLAVRILPSTGQLCIVDPKRLLKYDKNVKVYTNAKRILWDKPKRFIYRPKPKDLDNMDAYNLVYKYCYERKNFFVYTDDVVGIMDRTRYPKYLRICYQMGRERKVAMLSTFQRPAWVPMFLCSEATKLYCFRLTVIEDVRRVRSLIPGYDLDKLDHKHTFCYHDIFSDNTVGIYVRLTK